ncbi:hypothetical protein GCM10028895_36480 [Pontibacter rugosus]
MDPRHIIQESIGQQHQQRHCQQRHPSYHPNQLVPPSDAEVNYKIADNRKNYHKAIRSKKCNEEQQKYKLQVMPISFCRNQPQQNKNNKASEKRFCVDIKMPVLKIYPTYKQHSSSISYQLTFIEHLCKLIKRNGCHTSYQHLDGHNNL